MRTRVDKDLTCALNNPILRKVSSISAAIQRGSGGASSLASAHAALARAWGVNAGSCKREADSRAGIRAGFREGGFSRILPTAYKTLLRT